MAMTPNRIVNLFYYLVQSIENTAQKGRTFILPSAMRKIHENYVTIILFEILTQFYTIIPDFFSPKYLYRRPNIKIVRDIGFFFWKGFWAACENEIGILRSFPVEGMFSLVNFEDDKRYDLSLSLSFELDKSTYLKRFEQLTNHSMTFLSNIPSFGKY